MFFIPAIDLIDGKCVRLTQGDFAQQKVYSEDPLEVAKAFVDAGLKRLHLVDLDGARNQRITNHRVLERLATHTELVIDFGGGLKTDDDLRIAFECGAAMVTGGSIAVREPDTFLRWLALHGPERIILGADFKAGKIAISGWQEQSEEELMAFLEKYQAAGVRYTISTDVSKDGLLAGSALDTYAEIRRELPQLMLIASGGIQSVVELERLRALGCYGAIIGKALYEGHIALADLTKMILY